MLNIKNVSARNFMSIGAQTQAVNFENNNLTLVLGHNLDMGGDGSRNGTGKTTIVNALSYALYGEALTNIKKDNLINKTNGKGMIVSTEFEIDGTDYRIERGRRPNVLRLLVDGIEQKDDDAQGDSRETQKAIEQIVGFPHEMFKQLIALNTYTTPFLSLRPNDQRAMIEQLLGITDLSAKADVLKELLKNTKNEIKEEEIRVNAVKDSNERIEQNIKGIEMRSKAWTKTHTDKIAELEATIVSLSQIDVEADIEAHKLNAQIKEINDAVSALSTELKRSETSKKRSDTKLAELTANLTAAEEGVCPACNQGTAHLDTHEGYITELKDKIAEENKYNKELVTRIAEVQDGIDSFADLGPKQSTFYKTVEEAYAHKHNLESLATQYSERLEDVNPYIDQINSLRETGLQEINWDTMNNLVDLRDHQDFLYKLLTNKDSFIRKRIIDQNIAYLNGRLAYYLEKIGLPHEVRFAADLNVEITEYGRDLDFDNLSRGERNRLILSLSWAFRDIYESLNRPMNLLVIDELIDSGMDTVGVENSLGILKKMNREHKKNIMLISHKEELVGRVNNVLTVIKEGGFTAYNTDTEYVN